MEKLRVPQLSGVANGISLQEISTGLDNVNRYAIERMPWPVNPDTHRHKPQVSFAIAYSHDAILLKYFVRENHIRISCHRDNGPVHEDSCVEFFIAFDEDEEYYNLEFNSAGTCLFGYGKSRQGRHLMGKPLISRIRRQGKMESWINDKNHGVNWELVIMIPLDVFVYHRIYSLKDRQCRVNFYKCGDKLPEPHFLAWKNVEAESPDFHLPEFFGNMQFV